MLNVRDETLRDLTAALNNAATSMNRIVDLWDNNRYKMKLGTAVLLRNIEKVAGAAGMSSLRFPNWMKEIS